MFPEPKKEEVVSLPEMVVESSKSGYSSKSAKEPIPELLEMPVFPNPLDRIELQWQPPIIHPPIINPPEITNVNP